MGPISRQRVGAKDPAWGVDATHEQQVDVSMVLLRPAQHYGFSCAMTFDHRGLDDTRAIILAAWVVIAAPWLGAWTVT